MGRGEVIGVLRIWTDHGFDVFYLWRWLLAVSGGVYLVVKTIDSLNRFMDWLEARDRLSRIRRRYVMIHLLRLRLRDFWGELLQIVVLLGLLILIIRGHYSL